MRTPTSDYWDDIATEWQGRGHPSAWRVVSDAVNRDLINRWLTPRPDGRALKTDLFDEAVSAGIAADLLAKFGRVDGVDISPALVDIVRARVPTLEAHTADVRNLPFPDGVFDAVVSNSTLDHFSAVEDIALALQELHRVLRREGTLLVTLDNPRNPVIALRNALPDSLRRRSGMVPFSVGATCGPRRLRTMLEETGFEVSRMDAVFHCPRILVVLCGPLIDRLGGAAARERQARYWMAFETLRRLPTRFLTGYFVAALAHKK